MAALVDYKGRAYATPPSGKMPSNLREKPHEQVFGVVGITELLCVYYFSTRPKERKHEGPKNIE
ncbi:hypothetical protein C0995_016071 [Termitomyces sp. Mi166|nr:hypothetical protein C0995_016071 [Termitomyces sp. Mi166\